MIDLKLDVYHTINIDIYIYGMLKKGEVKSFLLYDRIAQRYCIFDKDISPHINL